MTIRICYEMMRKFIPMVYAFYLVQGVLNFGFKEVLYQNYDSGLGVRHLGR